MKCINVEDRSFSEVEEEEEEEVKVCVGCY